MIAQLKPSQLLKWGAVFILLCLPSLAWSVIYRSPKLVVDSILILAVELYIPNLLRPAFRAAWGSMCIVMLLLEWNIFPESYVFYLGLVGTVLYSNHAISIIIAFGLLLLFVFTPIRIPCPNKKGALLLIALSFYLVVILAKMSYWGKDNLVWLRVPIVRSLQVAMTDGSRFLHASVIGDAAERDFSGHLFKLYNAADQQLIPQKVLMVVLESWGESVSTFDLFVNELSDSGVKILSRGYTSFHGSTLPAEVRELCGKNLNFNELGRFGYNCLPYQLTKKGYNTLALHGYDGTFYYRQLVYPAIGFKRSLFKLDMGGVSTCGGAFAGVCDDSLVDFAIESLNNFGSSFVYMMSLSAHEPVDQKTLEREYVLSFHSLVDGSASQKLNRALIVHTLKKIAATKPYSSNAVVYFVGDHNPPSGAEGSDLPRGKVPFLLVKVGDDR